VKPNNLILSLPTDRQTGRDKIRDLIYLIRQAGLTEDHGTLRNFDMGYSQSEFFVDLCVNVLVRPTRISPRQSGAAGPCSTTTLRGCTARPDRRLRTAVSSADRAESLGV
jgi:hypothetical protein